MRLKSAVNSSILNHPPLKIGVEHNLLQQLLDLGDIHRGVEFGDGCVILHQLAELFASLGLETDADTVRATIENYDKAVMAGEQPEGVKKTNPNALIGYAEKDESGNYLPETYKLDGVELRVPVTFAVSMAETPRYPCLQSLEAEECGKKDENVPSLVLRAMKQGERLWDIAKLYRTTVEAILAANELKEESAAVIGKLLLIPRRR